MRNVLQKFIDLRQRLTRGLGSVSALLVNVRAYNAAHAAGDEATMAQLKPALAKGLPLMDKAGLFGLFPPEEWIAGSNPGRTLVGELYLDFKAGQTQV